MKPYIEFDKEARQIIINTSDHESEVMSIPDALDLAMDILKLCILNKKE